MNEALNLPLTIVLMGELVKNNELGREVAAEGLEWPALDSSTEGGMRCNRIPVFAAGSVREMAIEVGNAAVLRDWMRWMMWRVSVGKPVMGSLERQTR